jgi:hypothetical protein
MRVRRLEELLDAARVRAAKSEATLHAAAPDLRLAPSRQRGPRRFRKSEIVRATLSALRETQTPIGVREIALRVLASKDIPADKAAIEATLYGVRKTVGSLTRRGITRKVGQGKATRHVLHVEGEAH